ncbi:adipocyte plasma membrane-associated protein-like [Antedon mediterranea]|uniref:adipocyte plasma membrane-associated protein-like n=1 Tax=Antedon mediterranea TaxID=105859 RepID=UPI003AF73434
MFGCALLILVSSILVILMFGGSEQWQTFSYKLPSPPKLDGILEPNTRLKNGFRLAEGKLVGPESLAMRDGILYTGTADGNILAIEDENKIKPIATFHQNPSLECDRYETEHLCGRPLGMRFHNDGFLYVVEAYSGLYKLNVTSGKMIHLLRSDDQSFRQPMKFVNDFDITKEGVVYISDTSSNLERRDFWYLPLRADKSGRIIKHDLKTNKTVTLLEDIGWANGVQLSPEEDYLLYSEGQFARIMKLMLKGPNSGKVEVFYENLPSFPDNIRLSRNNNTYWIATSALRKHDFSLYDFVTDKPWLRTLILKVFHPVNILKALPKYSLVLELDLNGDVIRTLHDPDGEMFHTCSEVLDTEKGLFLGSFQDHFIGKLYL